MDLRYNQPIQNEEIMFFLLVPVRCMQKMFDRVLRVIFLYLICTIVIYDIKGYILHK